MARENFRVSGGLLAFIYTSMEIVKYSIDSYKEINKKLLKLIFEDKLGYIKTEGAEELYTDYQKTKIEYGKEFFPEIWPTLKDFIKTRYHKCLRVKNAWFQSYTSNQYHGWHSHQSCQYSAVYFIALPSNMATEFYDIEKKKIYRPKVKEGDLLIFPSCTLHRSGHNKTDHRKTVISFNFDITDSFAPPGL